MYLGLSSVHIETIHDLYELAKKHNCKIRIVMNDLDSSVDDWQSAILDDLENKQYDGISKELREELENNCELSNLFHTHDVVTFELIDMNDENSWKHMGMNYHQVELYFSYEIINDVSEELQEWLESNSEDSAFIYDRDSYTEIYGDFKNLDTHINVYREGMALKNFGDLVCDYLKEPRIIRTY